MTNLANQIAAMSQTPDIVERYKSKVCEKGCDDCWPWLGSKLKKDGRGMMSIGGKNFTAPRVAWFVEHGEWPPADLFVCHSCDNANCVNPAHLWLGTNSDNLFDAGRKGRLWAQNDSKQIQGVKHGNAKLCDASVNEIRGMLAKGMSIRKVAEHFDVSYFAIWRIRCGEGWSHVA